jgi:hypothetical protein
LKNKFQDGNSYSGPITSIIIIIILFISPRTYVKFFTLHKPPPPKRNTLMHPPNKLEARIKF